MDASVADQSIQQPHQSSGPNQCRELATPARTVQGENKPQKRKRRGKKATGGVSEEDVEVFEDYSGQISDETRDQILKMKKNQDPFDEGIQQMVNDVLIIIGEEKGEEVDLAESALLVSGVSQFIGKQVNTLYDNVLDIAEHCTGRPKPQKKNRKVKVEGEEQDNSTANQDETAEGQLPNDENPSNETDMNGNPETHDEYAEVVGDLEVPMQVVDSTETDDARMTADCNESPLNNDNSAETQENSEVLNQPEPNENTTGENSGDVEIGNANEAMPTVEEALELEQQILEEIPGRCTRRQSDRLKNILQLEKVKERDYTLKKKKFDEDPPHLTSCHDEIVANVEDSIEIDEEETLPPVLEIMVGRKRQRLAININSENDDDGNSEACQSDMPNSTDVEECEATNKELAIPSSSDPGPGYTSLDHLSNDVQEQFRMMVEKLHAFPTVIATADTTTQNLYQNRVSDAIELLRKNCIVKTKQSDEDNLKAKPGPSKLTTFKSKPRLIPIEELLVQARQQSKEDHCKLTRTETASEAEVPTSLTLAALKRILCSPARNRLISIDSDKGTYRRLKAFADRVGPAIEKEKHQGQFDLKKYEMEVMDVTLKESQEVYPDDFLCPLTPTMAPSLSEDPKNLMLMSSPSRSRSSGNGSMDGSNWVPATNIFSGMKAPHDRAEVCRTFTAMLGMLSNKSLVINYDTLPSEESAKLITKLARKSQTGDIEKYPDGAKIMTSRCPDMDYDEVLFTPGFIASTQQSFEQDGDLSSSGYQSDGQASCSTSGASYFPRSQQKSVADAMKEFVADPDDDNSAPLNIDDYLPTRKRKN